MYIAGKVDATVEVKIHRNRHMSMDSSFKALLSTFDDEQLLMPLELKTGKMFSKLGSIDHRAQVLALRNNTYGNVFRWIVCRLFYTR